MQFVKLQLGCLLAIAYIEISYIRATMKGKIPCNPFFDALLAVAPWAVFFDGLTAWTVNHMDIVPEFWNRSAHLLFFLSMDLTVLITTGYIYDRLLGFRNQEKEGLLLGLPGTISLIIAGLGELVYIPGKTTWYSMGFPVYVCYGTVILYYGSILYFVITRRRFLPRDKLLGTLSFIVIAGIILAVQVIFPEVLLTSLFPALLLLGIYMDFENPFLRKVTMQRDEMVNGFATMVECRDNDTGGHINRTRGYVDLMLGKMRYDRRYRPVLSRDYLENVSNADFRQIAYEVARFHHEKYNGSGYPDGLKGEDIPLHARVMAIADVFDAVSQRRCYRDAMSVEESFSILEKGSGSDFDPNIVRIFLDARREVIALMNAHPAKTE